MSNLPPPPSYNEANSNINYTGGQPAPYVGGAPQAGGYPPVVYPGGPPQQQGGYPPVVYPGGSTQQQGAYPPTTYSGAAPQQAGYQQTGDQPKFNGEDDVEHGEGFAASNFNDTNVRRNFIRKVYLILTAQLLVTCLFICMFQFIQPLQKWVKRNSWFYFLSYAVFLVTYITLVCCPSVRRKYPGNFIALGIFTLAFSYMTATITCYYSIYAVLIATGITTGVCLGVSIFAMQTRIDFTLCSGLILILSLIFFFFGLSVMIVFMVSGYNHILQCVYGALGALLFALFLAYDTQMVLGGKKHQLNEEEYIFGALQLYLDIVYIFLFILSCFGSKN